MAHAEEMQAHAYADGELDAAGLIAFEKHLEGCADCQTTLAGIEETRGLLRQPSLRAPADAVLRGKVIKALDHETRPRLWNRSFWTGAFSGGAGVALAACLALLLFAPAQSNVMAVALADAHQRSLLENHLIDVPSSSHHIVKPWLASHADVSPQVPDAAGQGFALVGGRSDMVDGARAAVAVYRHGAHVINVFAWPDRGQGLPRDQARNGFNLQFWRSGGIAYGAASDAAPADLTRFVEIFRKAQE
jgi:anti-sigma factor RsiW